MKKKLLGILLSAVFAAASLVPMTMTVQADSEKVVTLGANLDENQKNAVLRYFGVLGQNVRTLTITNQDERNHLASYVPIEQIGTRTFSCALVNPTASGGIRVKTANLNWVTGNMIASTLSTSGVKNCEVLAAAPFPVSGTGALTGVIMAYEDASGTTLDPTKKDIAAQELVATTTLANTVGQTDATNIVNEIKIHVIEKQVADPVQVEQIVENVIINESPSPLPEEDRALLNELANRIAQQQYDYEEMKETLERVEQNVNADANASANADVNVNVDVNINASENSDNNAGENPGKNSDGNTDEAASDNDSIMNSVDETAFGYEVVTTTTEEPEEEVRETSESGVQQSDAQQSPQDAPFEIVSTDTYTEEGQPEEQTDSFAGEPEQGQFDGESAEEWNTEVWVQEPAEDGNTEVWEQEPAEVWNTEVWEQEPETEDQPVSEQPQETEDQPVSEQPQETAPAEIAQLPLDDNTVKIFPAEGDNVCGAGVLRLRVAADSVVPAAGDDGSFGEIVVSGPMAYSEIRLQDDFDPTAYDSAAVALQKTSDADLETLGWSEGTDILIDLGKVFAFGDDPANQYTIEIRNLTLVQTGEDGTVTAKGVLNKTVTVYVDRVGLAFDISDISEMKAGGIVNGYIIMPADPEDGSAVHAAYIDCPSGISFTVGEDGRSFRAELQQAGDAGVTVNVTEDGENYVPYTLTIPVLQNDF